jgi:hypothetical protein
VSAFLAVYGQPRECGGERLKPDRVTDWPCPRRVSGLARGPAMPTERRRPTRRRPGSSWQHDTGAADQLAGHYRGSSDQRRTDDQRLANRRVGLCLPVLPGCRHSVPAVGESFGAQFISVGQAFVLIPAAPA